MDRNIFIIGMDELNLATMQRLREAHRYTFHGLLSLQQVRKADAYDYERLVANADERLRGCGHSVDAIATWWDFPSTGLLAVLSELWDLPGPDLRSIVALEHKYWARLEQRAAAGDHVPPFTAFDPFDDDALATIQRHGVAVPFWVKPVKSVGSYLGFRVDSPADFRAAMVATRAGIAQFGEPFQQVLDRVDAPPSVRNAGALACIAESIISGWQCTVEGYVSSGNVVAYGLVDSITEPNSSTFRGYQYPSRLPTPIQQRMFDIATDVIRHVGLDNCCFNVEFFYDPSDGHIRLLEVNPRTSQSHCELFAKVDGASTQRAMLDVAQGRFPRMPHRQGTDRVAGRLYLRTTTDGVVHALPDDDQIRQVTERFPGIRITFDVEVGDRLSDLNVQEPYSYELGHAVLGADSHAQLDESFEQLRTLLEVDMRQ
ncbi:MAG: ATP-grasp domain-containing protein [Nitriliruptoraceae bacterium]